MVERIGPSKALIEKLRDHGMPHDSSIAELCREAADRIEELERQLDKALGNPAEYAARTRLLAVAKDLHDFMWDNHLVEVSAYGEMAAEGLKKRMNALKEVIADLLDQKTDQECDHDWRSVEVGYASDAGFECNKCGEQKTKLW